MSERKKKYLHSIIMFVIMFGFSLFPNIGQITDSGMKVLGVTFGMLYGWIFIDMILPSICGLFLLGTTGLMNTSEVFSAGFGHTVVVASVMFLTFSEMMDEMHVSDYIASTLLSQKVLAKRPWLLVTTILLTAYLIGMLCEVVPAILLTWSFALAITDKSGYKRSDNIVTFLICGIVFAGCLGSVALPVKAAPFAFRGFYTAATGLEVDMGQFALVFNIIFLIAIVLVLLIAKFIVRLDVSKLHGTEQTNMQKENVTNQQKLGLFLVLAMNICLLLPSFLPQNLPVTVWLNNWGTAGIVIIFLLIPSFIRDENGKPMVSIGKLMSNVGWDFFWLVMAIMVMAAFTSNPETGIMVTISSAVAPVLQNISPIMFLIFATFVVAIVTQIAANIIVGAVFIPIFVPLYMAFGGNPLVCFMVMYCGLQAAFATPAASMAAALMFSNENIIKKQAYGYGVLFMLIVLAVGLIVGIPLVTVLN